MTEREKMLAGGWFDPRDAELTAIRDNATRLMHRLNVELCGHDDAYRAALRELCPGCEGFIREPFRCDYGLNISIGKGSFVNFDCVFLDLAPIRIGRHTLIGPKVQLLTALHPFDAAQRRTGLEAGRPITVGDDCWLGGGVIVCPGVAIGDRSVIGAGAVVTRDIPADSVAEAMEKAREAYAATRKEALGAIVRKADKIKNEIRDLDVDIASKQSRLAELQGRGQALAARRDEAAQAVEAAKAAPTMDTEGMERAIKMGDEYQDLANEAEELRSQLLSIASGMDSAADWVNELHKEQDACGRALARLQGQELPLHSSLGMVAERERVQGLIAEEEVREKNLAAEVARLERLEYEAASFVKADIESQEDAVNALFRVARFRMFDYTLDGGAVETCECTTQQGVRYGSMNDARKIQCGMDVIRVLSERYGVSAPIFIDNAESITQREFDNDAQVIRLVVKAGSELTIINE